MRRFLNSLRGRLVLLQLLLYAVLLPLLFFGLDALARQNALATFTRHARSYATSLARALELGDTLESPSRTVIFLDGSVEGGGCLYAAVEFNGRILGSSAVETPAWVQARGDDVRFGNSGDPVYAVAIPLVRGGLGGHLYLGFDKSSTLEQLHLARRQIIEALGLYGLCSLIAAMLLARYITRPLIQLQVASRRVAQGDTATHLRAESGMLEIAGLASDLENMRTELVGTADKLRAEIQQRLIEQAERVRLENHLRHEQRLATVGTLAGGVAHEFNNILLPLILYTEEALDDIPPDHPARPNLTRVLKAAIRASDVVSKLLSFSRPRADRPFEPIRLARVVSEALDLSEALIPPNVQLRREITSQDERILADATLLNQVVLNLCSNAVLAIGAEEGVVTVSVTSCDRVNASDDHCRVLQLRLKDTGIGMSPEIQERIFEPFFTTRDVGQGSGLGLSVVHGIVTSFGGHIEVTSVPGQGTEFVLEFPTIAETAPAGGPLTS
jgi:signal transduction histidine kinase